MNMQRAVRHRGFTFVELCIGLLITALVMSALATFTLATCSAWQSCGQVATLTLQGNQIVSHMQNEIRNARLLGVCRAGSSGGSATGAAIMIWKSDTNGDGLIQGSEVEMILHDTTNHQLVIYSGTAADTSTWSYNSVFTNSTVISTFQSGRTPSIFATNVYGAVFATTATTSTTLNPSLQFALKILSNDTTGTPQMLVQYGAATVRTPIAQPSN
jgi:Tfp pilus assembly protein PilW